MFFEPLPEPEEIHEQRWIPPEWMEPSFGELPASVPMDRVLARTANMAFVLRPIEVHRNGIRLVLQVLIVRRELDLLAWSELTAACSDSDPSRSTEVLRIGVSFADGSRVEAPQWMHPESTPDGPMLTRRESGGGGGTEIYVLTFGFWLWPAPPAEPFTLHWMWQALDIPEGSLELDGAAFAAAREHVQLLWPGDAD
ncbi:hypothetical protein [Salinibacterium sp. ZJ77]|uniref:hypothetical protein n=1 Tax=Salinibacterium sp. ZJ77 TaxID=2708337 RepID=UPI001421EF6D|nr:hypothetical protein [Salinibacterium sp. ZJ77]